MTPSTQRVCLEAFDKTICFNIPTLEGIKQLLFQFHRNVLVQHPYISAAVLLLWSFYPQLPFHLVYFLFYVIPRSILLDFLACIGFEREGVRTDSIASRYQAYHYQGHTPRNGVFAGFQSYGAINRDLSTAQRRESHSIVEVFWRFVGWLILYASLVVLLKYGRE